MHTHPKSFRPIYPPGSIVGIDLEKNEVQLNFNAGNGVESWMEFDPKDKDIILGLYSEVGLLRKIVKEMVRREGIHVSSPNEFHRGLASFAQKIKEDPDVVWELMKPYFEDFLKQMFERPSRQQAHGTHQHPRQGGHRNGNHERRGGGH